MFKRLIVAALIFFYNPLWAADSALQVDFLLSGYVNPTTKAPLENGYVLTYLDGTSTLSALWTDKDKGGVATNPFTLDTGGKAEVFGDNIYKFEIYEGDPFSGGSLIETLNGLEYQSVALTTTVYSPDYQEPDQGVTGGGSTVKAFSDLIGSDFAKIVFQNNSGTGRTKYTFLTSFVLPDNIEIEFEPGAYIDPDSPGLFSGMKVLTPEMWGAIGDDVISDADEITAMSLAITSNSSVVFAQKTYFIESTTPIASAPIPNGVVIINIDGKDNVKFIGNGCRIQTTTDHDIALYGGLRFLNTSDCDTIDITDFYFDLRFTGFNNSSLYYPWVGALTFADIQTAGQDKDDLNQNISVRNCKFKQFHPKGILTVSQNPYLGDSSNGYKNFSIFAYGPFFGQVRENQSSNFIIDNCTLVDGHNAYGFWIWAWNDGKMINSTAEAQVGKSEDYTGAVVGGGEGMLRYTQAYCQGLYVSGNTYRAKPCEERVSGFEGNAQFLNLQSNLTAALSQGETIVTGNEITLGNGDKDTSVASGVNLFDDGIRINLYGNTIISDNVFDAIGDASNAFVNGGGCINQNSIGFDGGGTATLNIHDNDFGIGLSYVTANIKIASASQVSDEFRRLKKLTVTNNTSLSQCQYFLDMHSDFSLATYPYQGSAQTIIKGNSVRGTYNSVFDKTNPNSRAFRIVSTGANDQLIADDNQVYDKYYAWYGVLNGINASNDLFVSSQNFGVTVDKFQITNWKDPSGTFQNGWLAVAGQSVPGYIKYPDGEVCLKGLHDSGTIDALMWNVPAGYRPPKDMQFPTISGGGALSRAVVFSSGNIFVFSGTNTGNSLDGICYRTDE